VISRRSGAPRPSSPPKLEDFLGGGINGAGSGGPVSVAETPAAEMYDSDLKFIAAGFMQSGAVGAAAPSPVSSCSLDQADPKLGLPAAAVPAPEQWKAVDSFGQRTSIYRGVKLAQIDPSSMPRIIERRFFGFVYVLLKC